MDNRKPVIKNLEEAATQLVNYLCANTEQLKIAVTESKNIYVPFSSLSRYFNPLNYARWLARNNYRTYVTLEEEMAANDDSKKLKTLNSLINFFHCAREWTTTSASYTLFKQLLAVTFHPSQLENLGDTLLAEFKDSFLKELQRQSKILVKLQTPTQPINISSKGTTALTLANLPKPLQQENGQGSARRIPGKLKDSEQHTKTAELLNTKLNPNVIANLVKPNLSTAEQPKTVQQFKK